MAASSPLLTHPAQSVAANPAGSLVFACGVGDAGGGDGGGQLTVLKVVDPATASLETVAVHATAGPPMCVLVAELPASPPQAAVPWYRRMFGLGAVARL